MSNNIIPDASSVWSPSTTPPNTPPQPRKGELQARHVIPDNQIEKRSTVDGVRSLVHKLRNQEQENEKLRDENQKLQKEIIDLGEKFQNSIAAARQQIQETNQALENTQKTIQANEEMMKLVNFLLGKNDKNIIFLNILSQRVNDLSLLISSRGLNKEKAKVALTEQVEVFNTLMNQFLELKILEDIVALNNEIKDYDNPQIANNEEEQNQLSVEELISIRDNTIDVFNRCMKKLRKFSDRLKDLLIKADPEDSRLQPGLVKNLKAYVIGAKEYTAKRIFALPGDEGFIATPDLLVVPKNWEYKPAVAFEEKKAIQEVAN